MRAPSAAPRKELEPEEVVNADQFLHEYLRPLVKSTGGLHHLELGLEGIDESENIVFSTTFEHPAANEFAEETRYRTPLMSIARLFRGIAVVDSEVLSNNEDYKHCRFIMKIKIPRSTIYRTIET